MASLLLITSLGAVAKSEGFFERVYRVSGDLVYATGIAATLVVGYACYKNPDARDAVKDAGLRTAYGVKDLVKEGYKANVWTFNHVTGRTQTVTFGEKTDTEK